jgi:hypothetical protein
MGEHLMSKRWIRYMLGGVALVAILTIAAWPVCVYTWDDAARNHVRSVARDVLVWDVLHPGEPDRWETEIPPSIVVLERGPGGWPVTLSHKDLQDYVCVVHDPAAEPEVTVRCGSRNRL